jgi:hypothetical protein
MRRLESEMFLVDCVVCSGMLYWITSGRVHIIVPGVSVDHEVCTPVV